MSSTQLAQIDYSITLARTLLAPYVPTFRAGSSLCSGPLAVAGSYVCAHVKILTINLIFFYALPPVCVSEPVFQFIPDIRHYVQLKEEVHESEFLLSACFYYGERGYNPSVTVNLHNSILR